MPRESALLLLGVTAEQTGDAPVRQNSDFYYLSGFNQTDATLLLVKPQKGKSVEILFCRQPSTADILWRGRYLAPTEAAHLHRFSIGYPISELRQHLRRVSAGCFYYPIGRDSKTDEWVTDMAKNAVDGPKCLMDSGQLLDPMRLIKDRTEILLIKEASRISMAAHRRVADNRNNYSAEYEAEADLLHTYRRMNARVAFHPIVAGGANACVLHYMQNDRPYDKKQVLLVDSGAEYGRYCSDITRTYVPSPPPSQHIKNLGGSIEDNIEDNPGDNPVGAIHRAVLRALRAACAAAKIGATLERVHLSAVKCLIAELGSLGIIKDTPAVALAKGTYKRYFPHRTSHWIGLDVHDVGARQALRPGMVFSVEPGLYFAPDDETVAPKWRGMGVRLEDTVLMTDKGAENLTAELPYGGDRQPR